MTDSTGKNFFVGGTSENQHPVRSLTIAFSDGTEKTVKVIDTAIIINGGYTVNGQSSVDGSFPTTHTFAFQWIEDADPPGWDDEKKEFTRVRTD